MGTEIEDGNELTVAATGDSMLARRLSCFTEKPYLSMVEIIRGADVAFTNVEGIMHNYEGYPNREGTVWTLTSPPPYTAEELKWMGFNMVSTANNHVMDYSEESMLAGLRALDSAGLVQSGVGRNLSEARFPAFLDTKKGRVALISATTPIRQIEMASYDAPGVRGMPGVNGIRIDTTYAVDRASFEELKRISSLLKIKEILRLDSLCFEKDIPYRKMKEDEFIFINDRFSVGDKPGVYMTANKADVEANLREIHGARRLADWVLVSYHAHEGAMDNPMMIPAPFIREFARDCIDAGADAVIGHGHHEGYGIEIYKGKPIFYSLGTFIMQSETLRRYPSGTYEKVGLDPARATPADVVDAKSRWLKGGNYPPQWWFKAVIAVFTLRGEKLAELRLYPVDLKLNMPRSRRGRPMLADEKVGGEIIERYKKLSVPFGTEIEFKEGIGIVKV